MAKLTFIFATLLGILYSTAAQDTCQSAACKAVVDDLHSTMNLAANPCDDFYEYVCGSFPKTHPLTATENRNNAFAIRTEQVHHELDAAFLSEEKSSSLAVKFASELYLECNNTEHQESRGVKPLQDLLTQSLNGWPLTMKTHGAEVKSWIDQFLALFTQTGVSPFFRIGVNFERHMNSKFIFIQPAGTGIPHDALYPTRHENIVTAYKNYMHQAAIILGATEGAKLTADIDKVIALESQLAMITQTHLLNMIQVGNYVGLNNAVNHTVDFLQIVNHILTATKSTLHAQLTTDRVAVVNLAYLHAVIDLVAKTEAETLHNLLSWLVVSVFGPITTHKFRQIEAQYRAVLTGVPTELPTSEFCFNIANSKLPFALGRVYVDKHFSPEEKKQATILVEEIKASFKKNLETNTWLDAATKQLALEKLAAVKENVAYPEWMMNNADLDKYYTHLDHLKPPQGRFFEAAVELNVMTVKHQFDELTVPLNHSQLLPMTPATVNAAYQPTENAITIPAAILNKPFFDASRPFSMNYGAIGAIIGHEFTHGFDQNGRRFDLNGGEKDWWTNTTSTEFTHRAQCFIKQYSDIVDPITMLHLNGVRTLGENIADNGGVKESFAAFHNHEAKYGKSPLLPGLNLTSDQLYYVSYARNWCSVMRKESLVLQINTNPHPPDRYRVNTVLSNSNEFAQTWKCAAGSKMIATDKCAVW